MSVSFRKALKDVVLREIDERVSSWVYLWVIPATREDQSVLSGILKLGVLTPDELESADHNRLCVLGQLMYAEVVKGQYPDHVSSPKALAYALRHDETTRRLVKEKGRIALDRDETLESFEAQADGLLEKIVQQLMDGPQPVTTLPLIADAGTICEGCGE